MIVLNKLQFDTSVEVIIGVKMPAVKFETQNDEKMCFIVIINFNQY